MTSPILGRSNPLPTFCSKKWEPLKRVAEIFNLEISIGQNNYNYEKAREACFRAAFTAYKEKQWDLLQHPSLSHVTDACGRTLLMHAISNGDKVGTKHFIKHKISIEGTDSEGNNAAHIAAMKGSLCCFKYLYDQVDYYAKNKEGKTLTHVAIDANQPGIVEVLAYYGIGMEELFALPGGIQIKILPYAIMRKRKNCVRALLPYCNLKKITPKIGNLLHVAVSFSQFTVLKILFDYNIGLFKELLDAKNDENLTPLSLAAKMGDTEAIEYLYNKGASLEDRGKQDFRPLHHAAKAQKWDAFQLLISLGADVNIYDTCTGSPRILNEFLKEDKSAEAKAMLELLNEGITKGECSRKSESRNPPPENMSLKGGGARGVTYVGAVSAFEERGMLEEIRRFAGTSAGAIVATALALNYSSQELSNLLNSLDLTQFLDHPFSDLFKKIKEKFGSINKFANQLFNFLKTVCNPINIITAPIRILIGPFKIIWDFTGLCEGEKFRSWIENQIANQVKTVTGKRVNFLTFGELNQFIDNGYPFRHLHVFGTRIDKREILHFSSEDPNCSDVIISDAIRISMSIPGVFKPHKVHVKKNHQNEVSRNGETGVDGGLIYNSPFGAFDEKQYQTHANLGEEGRRPEFNEKTIGINLYSSTQPKVKPRKINNIKNLFMGVALTFRHAETELRDMNPYHQKRIIDVDIKDVGALSFKLSDDQKQEMIKAGKQAVFTYFDKNPIQDINSRFELKERIKRLQGKISLREPLEQFSGREKLLKTLEENLIPKYWNRLSPGKIFNLYGSGGIGKTELAITFANRHIKDFSIIWFIHADSDALYREDYSKLAQVLRIDIGNKSTDSIVKKVHKELSEREFERPFLLIFDNVETLRNIPERGGFVLATSQHKDIYPNSILVPAFTESEAKELFSRSLSSEELSNYETLVEKCEGYPLLLDHARLYISNNQITVGNYLATLDENTWHKFKKEKVSDYPRSFEDTYRLTFQRLKTENTDAFNLLQLLAYFNSDDISPRLFKFYMKENGKTSTYIYELMRALENLSLVHYDQEKKTYFIHRNIQIVLKQQHEAEKVLNEKANETALLLKNLLKAFNPDDPITWETGRVGYIHVHWQKSQSFWEHVDKNTKWTLLSQSGEWLRVVQYDFQKSLSFQQQAMALVKELHGENILLDSIRILNHLGNTWFSLGDYEQSIKIFSEALDMCKEIHARIAYIFIPWETPILNQLGKAHSLIGNHSESSRHFKHAFDMINKFYKNRNHPICVQTLNNLGELSLAISEDYQAIEHFEHALSCSTQIYGEAPNPETVQILTNLGKAKAHIGEVYEARDLLKRALIMCRAIYGDVPHPTTAQILNLVGITWFSQNNFDMAIKCYERALKMNKQIYKKLAHPYIAQVFFNLGNVYLQQENYMKAIDNYGKAFEMFKQVYKEKSHQSIAVILKNLGNISSELKNPERAKEQYYQAFREFAKIHKEMPAAVTFLHLGDMHHSLGRESMAFNFYNKALEFYAKDCDKKPHQIIGAIYAKLGYLRKTQKKFPTAIEYFVMALNVYQKVYKENPHHDIANIRYELGVVCFLNGDNTSAINYYEEALEVYTSLDYNKPSKKIALTLHALGDALYKEEKFQPAKKYFQRAFLMNEKLFGLDHESTQLSKKMMRISENNSCSIS